MLFFQHWPRFDILPDIGKIATLPNKNGPRVDIVREIRYIYNHKSLKMSREKNYKSPRRTRARFRAAAPLFTVRKGDTNPPEIDRRNHPQNPPQNTPENHPETVPKSPPKTPLPNPSRHRTDNQTPPPQNLTRVLLGPDWVRPGSELGPNPILWKLYHIPPYFPKHHDTFQPTKNPP